MSMNLTDLKRMPVSELVDMAREMGLDNQARSRKQEVIAAIVRKQAKAGEDIYGEGTLEILQDGFGFLRSADSSYLAGPKSLVRKLTTVHLSHIRVFCVVFSVVVCCWCRLHVSCFIGKRR